MFLLETSKNWKEKFRYIINAMNIEIKNIHAIQSLVEHHSEKLISISGRADNSKAKFGTGDDLQIYHDSASGQSKIVENGPSVLKIQGSDLRLTNSANTADYIQANDGAAVKLFYNGGSAKFETTDTGVSVTGGVVATGVVTAAQFSGGGIGVGIQSGGNLIGYGVTTLNFVGSGNTFAINGTTVDVSIAGGGGGGVSEVSTDVNSTSPTGVGSFAVATYRSAAIIAQVDQSGTYQVGRYLMIHDGTTVTVVEEASVSTGASQIASYDGAIVGTNAEFRVTMVSSGIATVTTKIDTVTAYS